QTDPNPDKCEGDSKYKLMIEQRLIPHEVIAAYLDCDNKGYIGFSDGYANYESCITFYRSEIGRITDCEASSPSIIGEDALVEAANNRYQELTSLVENK
ncbi:MAG: hypothetical protein IH819_12460, partial [Bacteroidetes bacterium]|nr:hypothetical protein [Bacteroidota bacterium]